jgi:hypothetical protein
MRGQTFFLLLAELRSFFFGSGQFSSKDPGEYVSQEFEVEPDFSLMR